jgi:hypothetical protein
MVIAVTDETRSLVDAYVKKNQPKYPVVIESVDSGTTFGIVGGFPTQYVIDAAGKIAWAGNFFDQDPQHEAILERLLKDARFAPPLTPALAAQDKLVQAGKHGEAWVALEKVAANEKADAADREAAGKMVKWLQEEGDREVAEAKAKDAAGDPGAAALAYEKISAQYAGTPIATQSGDLLKELLADPKKKKETDAAKALVKLRDKVDSLDKANALPHWKLFIAKWKGTRAAEQADQVVKEMTAK